jgi:hypothetical protein
MTTSLYHKLLLALKQAENHNSSIMVKPEVILWSDPENQWLDVIPVLQESHSNLIVYGKYSPEQKKGPTIWLKCMVASRSRLSRWRNPNYQKNKRLTL